MRDTDGASDGLQQPIRTSFQTDKIFGQKERANRIHKSV